MSRALRECLLMWRSAVTSSGAPVWRPVELASAGLLGVLSLAFLLFVKAAPSKVFAGAVLLPAGVLLLLFWIRFVNGVIGQNSPANAALVPRLNRRLRQTAALSWGITVLSAAAVMPWVQHGPLVVLVTAMGLLLIAMALGGQMTGAILVFLAGELALAKGGAPLWNLMSLPAVQFVMTLVLALVGWAVLHFVLPAAGERHWKAYNRQALRFGAMTSPEKAALIEQRRGYRRPLYSRWLTRRTTTRRAGGKPARVSRFTWA